MQSISSRVNIQVSPKMAYRAFTNATSLREWLCDVATVEPRPNGRIYLWWNGDFFSSGQYIETEENKNVIFRWHSNQDSAPTEVSVSFEQKGNTTQVTLKHQMPDGDEWKEKGESFKHHWDNSFENLKSVLETGIDLRIANRPMVGLIPGDFTPEQAAQLGVPVTEGMRIDGVVDGMGAQKAGLQKNDVLVGINGVTVTNDFSTFNHGIAGKKGGDSVEVVYYRGAEKKNITMELTKRPMADVPFNAAELAKIGREKFDAALTELEKCFDGVTDVQATKRPGPNEWSALDVMAHLLQGERFWLSYFSELVNGFERAADGFGDNIDASVRATVSVYPTIAQMLAALNSAVDETLAYVANLPDEFVKNRGSFYRVGNILVNSDIHINSHIPQITSAIVAAK